MKSRIILITVSLTVFLALPVFAEDPSNSEILKTANKFFTYMIQRVDPFSPSTSQTQLSKEQIEKILNEEKQKRTTALKKIVYKDIIFSELTKNQLHQLGIQMLSDEISILEYMIKISGHNIYQFANLEYKLIDYKIFNNVYKDIIDQADSAKKKNVFSIRGIISYKEGSRSFKKKWEMQLIREPENKFMIIGFIL